MKYIVTSMLLGILAVPVYGQQDVTGDGRFDEVDAKSLYIALHPAFTDAAKRQLFADLIGSTAGYEHLKQTARMFSVDVTNDGTVDEKDALAIYYAHAFESVLGNGKDGDGSAILRRHLLQELIPGGDSAYRQAIRIASEMKPRGLFVVSGIDRIPYSALKQTNRQVATMVAITEYNRVGHGHYIDVRDMGCMSFIRRCTLSSLPFLMLGTTFIFESNITNDFLSRLPNTIKLVSVSILSGG